MGLSPFDNDPLPRATPHANWLSSLLAGAMAWSLSLFMAAPPFAAWSWSGLREGRARDFLRLCENPFARDLVEGMLAYRIATPLLAWLLGLPPAGALALAYVFSLATLVIVHQAVSRRS